MSGRRRQHRASRRHDSYGTGPHHARQDEPGLAACEQALELASHVDDPNIRYAQAAALEGIGILHDLGETWLTAPPLDNLGDVYHAAGDDDAARDSWKQAIAILDDSQAPGADEVRQKLRDLDV